MTVAPTQLIPGPIDALTQGILTGSRLAAMHKELQTRKLQNKLLDMKIKNHDAEFELEQARVQSQIDADNARANLQNTQVQELLRLSDDRAKRVEADRIVAEEDARAAQERGGLKTQKLPSGVMGPPQTTRGPSFQEQQQRREQKRHELDVDAKLSKIGLDIIRGSLPGASVLDDKVYTIDEARDYVQTELLPQINLKTGKNYKPDDKEVGYYVTQHHAFINRELVEAQQVDDRTKALEGHRAVQTAQADERIRQTQERMDKQASDIIRLTFGQLAARERIARKSIADAERTFVGGGSNKEAQAIIKRKKAPHVRDLTEILRERAELLGKQQAPGPIDLSTIKKGTELNGRIYQGPVPVTPSEFRKLSNWKKK